jgi:hypothetical protein
MVSWFQQCGASESEHKTDSTESAIDVQSQLDEALSFSESEISPGFPPRIPGSSSVQGRSSIRGSVANAAENGFSESAISASEFARTAASILFLSSIAK